MDCVRAHEFRRAQHPFTFRRSPWYTKVPWCVDIPIASQTHTRCSPFSCHLPFFHLAKHRVAVRAVALRSASFLIFLPVPGSRSWQIIHLFVLTHCHTIAPLCLLAFSVAPPPRIPRLFRDSRAAGLKDNPPARRSVHRASFCCSPPAPPPSPLSHASTNLTQLHIQGISKKSRMRCTFVSYLGCNRQHTHQSCVLLLQHIKSNLSVLLLKGITSTLVTMK